MKKTMAVYIHNGKAYLPRLANIPTGGLLEIDPVITTVLTVEALASAMQATIEAPHNMATPFQLGNVGAREGVVLRVSGMKSWKQFVRYGGQSFLVDFGESDIWFQQARADKQDRWTFVKGEEKILPPKTGLKIIAQRILDNI